MKIEFNQIEFSSIMNSDSDESSVFAFEGARKIFSENSSLILAVLSFIIALANLPFGLFMNFSTEALSKITEYGLEHWISALLVATAVMFSLSVICGVFSVVLFAKSDKKTSHFAGLVIAIVSFSLSAVCLGLNIAGLIAW